MRSWCIAAVFVLVGCAERTPVPEHPGHDHELPAEWTAPAPSAAPTETAPQRAREIRVGEPDPVFDAGAEGGPVIYAGDASGTWL